MSVFHRLWGGKPAEPDHLTPSLRPEEPQEEFDGHSINYWISFFYTYTGGGGTNQWTAAQALEKIGGPAVEPLIAELNRRRDGAWDVAAVLGRLGDGRAVEPLIRAINDKEYYTRLAAIDALGVLGDPRAVPPLLRVVEQGASIVWHRSDRGDDKLRLASCALEALGKIGDQRAIQPLTRALQKVAPERDGDYDLAGAFAKTLAQLQRQNPPPQPR